jgi:hypothetical protein
VRTNKAHVFRFQTFATFHHNQPSKRRSRQVSRSHDKAQSLIVDCGASWSVDFRVLAFFRIQRWISPFNPRSATSLMIESVHPGKFFVT